MYDLVSEFGGLLEDTGDFEETCLTKMICKKKKKKQKLFLK